MATFKGKKIFSAEAAINRERNTARHRRWYDSVKHTQEFKDKANALARKNWRERVGREQEAEAGEKPNTCGVCGSGGKICFDHCHATNKFRGWLCNRCNLVLGHAKDDPELLRKLADYLHKG